MLSHHFANSYKIGGNSVKVKSGARVWHSSSLVCCLLKGQLSTCITPCLFYTACHSNNQRWKIMRLKMSKQDFSQFKLNQVLKTASIFSGQWSIVTTKLLNTKNTLFGFKCLIGNKLWVFICYFILPLANFYKKKMLLTSNCMKTTIHWFKLYSKTSWSR